MSLLRILFLIPAALFVGSLSAMIWVGGAGATTPLPPANPPRTIVIGIDLSTSNPLIRDDGFAAKVAARIAPQISSLSPRSKVILRSFGAYNSAANAPLSLDITIAPKTARAEDIATLIEGVVGSVPRLVREGRIQEQFETNIVPFLLNMSRVVNCKAEPTVFILASDGVEDSQVANLKRRSATLPVPPQNAFAGCENLAILGIGRGLDSPRDTERLRDEWARWAERAGFRTFTGLNDW